MSKLVRYIKKRLRDISLYMNEKREYNNGICPECGKKMNLLYIDEDGERSYVCEDCVYAVWISLKKVDKYK